MIKYLSIGFLLVFLLISPGLALACDCESGPLYKGFSLSAPEGIVAKEFDKTAPAPGVNWEGTADVWIANASQQGWIVKTSPLSAMPGAIIVGRGSSFYSWVGIVRAVNENTVTFDYAEDNGKFTRYTANANELSTKFKLIGYIWPRN